MARATSNPTASQQANQLLGTQGKPGQYSTSGAYQVLGGKPSLTGGLLGGLGVGGGGGGQPPATAGQMVQQSGGGGGNVVGPPGTQNLQSGGFPQGSSNYQQQANPFLTNMLPQYAAYQNQLQSLYNENPEDMFAKLRANQSAMRNEQTQQAGQRGGMGMTNAGNWNTNRAEQQQLAQAGLDWKNMSLQNKQAAAGMMGQGLAGASGVAGNIAGNQLGMLGQQLAQNQLAQRAGEFQAMLPIEMYKAQTGGVASLLGSLSGLANLQRNL